ncbi:MAG: cadmium-translocating P-type ATPase [Kocuria rhizophila]|jgi:Cd2+/Zn2+-exporting ATPase|uniref:P-type Zn(2+) transporter n=2 Tax=Paracoccus TaxID=265 RepID=A0A1H3A1A2_9RHOB|nr:MULTISPECIES: heavy metal translocating P-type ATPase [Paracoccaceae]PZP29855.1 MAG: cadmium-translocating P-type ATPase [Kocuria rhizophila]QJD15733.1 cadmium-translocating P-type ATPase [Paracoccus sanguinis]SDX22699.1 Cd2+/Zn2+-exporting ATPase [Paracoccus sanguinis]
MTGTDVETATACDWTVSGMDCGSCATKIKDAVGRLPGVSGVEVGIMSERLRLTLDEAQTGRDKVEKTVRALGYGIAPRAAAAKNEFVMPGGPKAGTAATRDESGHGSPSHVHDDPADRGKRWYQTGKGKLVIFTALLLAVAWGIELLAPQFGKWAFVAACLIGVAPVAQRAFAALRLGQPFTIESLMTVAAIGALFIDAAEEAALVVFLFAVGEVLEGVAAGKARDGIRALANLVPKTAFLELNGVTKEVPAASLRVGQFVLVRPGDRVPADGEIAKGTSGIDESPVTGESMPKTRGPGDPVFAGSINTEAVLRVMVTKAAEDNTIARIIRLVEEAEEARAPTERFIDRFSRWYMPAIVTVAALVVLVPPLAFAQPWDTWIYRGLALLLIGCPCALVISVPASIASALSTGARRGLLMKGGAVIEAASKVSRIAFDKTGTLTHGRPMVTDIVTFGATTEAELLAVAAGVETGSSHPLAIAILNKATEAGVAALPSRDARALMGKGVIATVGDAAAWVTSPRHAMENGGLDDPGLRQATVFEEEGKTAVAVFREKTPLGLIAMRDEPRKDAAEAVRQLKDMGVAPVILTGDNPRTAAAIAGGLGMEFQADMMPEDKLTAIRDMSEHGGVMMIGDGINDAPALKQADVGVAMGSGTDVALETADAAILRDRVIDIPAMIRLARAAMANVRQNVAIALGLKAVFLVTTILGITGLWIAILADTGATVLVTLNALRLLAFKPEREA